MTAEQRRHLIALIFGIAASLAVANALSFVFEPWLGELVYDHDLGFRVRPYHNGANRFGFNDVDYPLTPDAGVYRILVLGDSFGWMGGRDGNYTAFLERLFEAHFGAHRVDVISAGYSMTHTAEQLAALRKFGLAYHPDLVVLGFFTGNDFIDADPNRRRIAYAAGFIDVDARTPVRTFAGRPLVDGFRLAYFARQQWTVAADRWRAFRESTRSEAWIMSHESWLKTTGDQMQFYRRSLHERHQFDDRIGYIFGAVSQMRELLDGRGIDFRVAILPAGFSVYRERSRAVLERFGWDGADYDLEMAQRILRPYLTAQHIPYIDLLEDFRRRGATSAPLYLPDDNHWSAAGNAAAAQVLYDWLVPDVEGAVSPPVLADQQRASQIQASRVSTAGASENRSRTVRDAGSETLRRSSAVVSKRSSTAARAVGSSGSTR